MLTGRQIREARSLLRLTQNALASKVRVVSVAAIMRAEVVDDEPPITCAQADALQRVFETAGVEFGPDGVRLREQKA